MTLKFGVKENSQKNAKQEKNKLENIKIKKEMNTESHRNILLTNSLAK